MRISFLKASGFRGIKESIDIFFPSGFAIISGRNGSGKSTICDAIEFALTGIIEKHYLTEKGEDISDYLWWRGTGRLPERYVSIGIVDEMGKELIVTRGPEGLINLDENEIRSKLCDLDLSPAEELKQLCRTSIIRDETITNLSVDLPEVDRFAFVKSAIGSRDFAPIEKRMKAVIDIISTQRTTLETNYQDLRNRINGLTADLSAAKVDAARVEDISDAERLLREVLGKLTEDVSSVLLIGRDNVVERRLAIESVTRLMRGFQEIERRRSQIETPEFKKTIEDCQAQTQELSSKLQNLTQEISSLNHQIDNERQGREFATSILELTQIGKSIGLQEGKCPLCGSRITENNFLEHIGKIRETIESREKTLAHLIEKRDDADLEANRVKIELERTSRTLRELVGQGDLVNVEFNELESEARKYGIGPAPGKNYPPILQKEIESRRNKLLAIEKAISTIESSKVFERILELERELEVTRRESAEIEKRNEVLRSAESRGLRALSEVKRILGEIVDERLAELSPLLKELYSRLRPHIDWPEISYHIRGDVRRFLSLKVGEELNPRFMFSSGQRRAAGLAFLLAVHLSRSWCRLFSLVLDDPIHHIDDYRALNLVELLAAIRRSGEQLICTTEDSALADLLCRRLRSVETDEGCLINLEYKPGEGVKVASCRQIYPFPGEVILSA
jgi:DNA repair exonuclease SbcCD ATPase subunit